MRVRRAWWGFAFGAVGGLLDTGLLLWLGIDLSVAGRDLTLPIALYLAATFAIICGLVGHYMDARAQARRDAETIARQLRDLDASRRIAAQNEKLAAIGRLAAGVAHEVRNPLGVIRASASMVQESFDREEEPYRACEFICEEIDRLNGLITSLLGFARPAEPRLRSVHMDKVIDRALQLAAKQIESRGVAVERLASGATPELRADPDLLAQAILDVLTNAVEAVGSEGRIALRLEGGAESVFLEIADDGPGVTLEDAERIFEPFFTTKGSGTGLGLAMTARIVERHGGDIQVLRGRGAGENDRGACFRLRLPVAGPPEPASERPS